MQLNGKLVVNHTILLGMSSRLLRKIGIVLSILQYTEKRLRKEERLGELALKWLW